MPVRKTIEVTTEAKVPRVPNFLLLGNGGRLRVGDLSDKELRRIADLWKLALLARGREQRAEKPAAEEVS